MRLPEGVRLGVERALAARGLDDTLVSVSPVAGGCINHGARVETSSGTVWFLKWNASAPDGMFAAEADGLRALREAGGLVVPEPVAWADAGTDARSAHDGGRDAGARPGGSPSPPASPAWLLMEHVERGPADARTDERLGIALAALHARRPGRGGPAFGWHRDNWIGSLPQANDPADSWGVFWRDRRVVPQLERARASGHLGESLFDDLVTAVPDALADVRAPGLLHGDLWSGNVFASAGGEPVLIDPAVYHGDGEVDLAMSELFGGFGRRFYDAYAEARGIGPEYGAYRRALYQLYYLLVHVNLFGASYVAGSRRAAEEVLSAVG